MDMDKVKAFDAALDRLMGDMDDMEGDSALNHGLEECSDPLTCKMHDQELGDNLVPEGKPEVKIEVKKMGLPSLDGGKEEGGKENPAEEGLSPEEAEELRRLLK